MDASKLFLAAGIAVVIDLHFWSPSGDAMRRRLFSDQKAQETFKRAIRELALRVSSVPDTEIALELLNEPPECRGGQQGWPQLQATILADIRELAPLLPVVVTGCGGQLDGLLQLGNLDFGDQRLIYSFHFYEPFAFTHQAAFYGLRGYPVPFPPDRRIRLSDKLPEVDPAHPERRRYAENDISKYLNSSFSNDQIQERLARIAAWADAKHIQRTRIFLGEWGAIIGEVPRDEGPRASELRWLTIVRQAAGALGFKHAFWLYPRESSYDYDSSKHWIRNDVAEAIGLKRRD